MLIVSELSEALEAYRDDNMTDPEQLAHCFSISDNEEFKAYFKEHIKGTNVVELADAFIRIADFAYSHNMPLLLAILTKMRYNTLRPYKHGGKKF